MNDFILRLKSNKVGFAFAILSVYLIGFFNSYNPTSSVIFSLFASVLVFCHKYYIIAMFEDGFSKTKIRRYVSSYFKLYPVFIVYAIIFVSIISICSAFIPELVPWGEKVLSGIAAGGVNEDLNLHLEGLTGANIINSVIAIFAAVVLMSYVLFAVLTTSVIMYKTNKFAYSLFSTLKFICVNWKSYLFVFAPLIIAALGLLFLVDIDLTAFVTVFIVYRVVGLFDDRFKDK